MITIQQIKNEQLVLKIPNETAVKACVFTGHRTLADDFSSRKTKKYVKLLIEQGVDTFYNGMAMGFDLFAAETVLALKKKYPHVKLVACIPCYEQERSFSDEDKKRYIKALKKADETVVLSQRYHPGCMQQRNRYMAERADVMIAYCNSETGGAAYTVKYFKKVKPLREILFI